MRLEPIFALHEQKIKSVSTWLTVSLVKHQREGGCYWKDRQEEKKEIDNLISYYFLLPSSL